MISGMRTRGWSSLKKRRTELRYAHSTEAERLLWDRLRNKSVQGMKFRRQHGIGHFVVDFYHPASMTVIELDGNIHHLLHVKEHDRLREEFLVERGYKVIRFQNEEIYNDIESVLHKIVSFISVISPFQGGHGV